MAAALKRRGYPKKEERQPWLDEFKHEYNHLRPHEALEMQTPATVWGKSERGYEPNPQPWEYEEGSEVVKVARRGISGSMDVCGKLVALWRANGYN